MTVASNGDLANPISHQWPAGSRRRGDGPGWGRPAAGRECTPTYQEHERNQRVRVVPPVCRCRHLDWRPCGEPHFPGRDQCRCRKGKREKEKGKGKGKREKDTRAHGFCRKRRGVPAGPMLS